MRVTCPHRVSASTGDDGRPERLCRPAPLAHRGTAFGDNLRAKFQHPALALQRTQTCGSGRSSTQLDLVQPSRGQAGGGGGSATGIAEATFHQGACPGCQTFSPGSAAVAGEAPVAGGRAQAPARRLRNGTGKSAIIACASVLASLAVVVPNKLLLKSMAEAASAISA